MTAEDGIRAALAYDPETGALTWRTSGKGRKAGDEAGYRDTRKGYRTVKTQGRQYKAHRVAWLLMTGSWPAQSIDHRNGVRDDNRAVNLREATPEQNQWNTRLPRRNTSGVKGVSWDKATGKWGARVMVGGRNLSVGRFSDLAQAAAAVQAARAAHHGEFARHQ